MSTLDVGIWAKDVRTFNAMLVGFGLMRYKYKTALDPETGETITTDEIESGPHPHPYLALSGPHVIVKPTGEVDKEGVPIMASKPGLYWNARAWGPLADALSRDPVTNQLYPKEGGILEHTRLAAVGLKAKGKMIATGASGDEKRPFRIAISNKAGDEIFAAYDLADVKTPYNVWL
jgi:hypothetical protein